MVRPWMFAKVWLSWVVPEQCALLIFYLGHLQMRIQQGKLATGLRHTALQEQCGCRLQP